MREFEFLRFDDDGQPAAGSFEGWPDAVAEVTVMDPCCGSGHFLVEAFGMLWRMRAEEEGLDQVVAQDAVLRDNLFGLELDPRCVQIAMFAVALTAWKHGGGWRELPTPNIACSGIPAKAPLEEWTALADADERLVQALERLHALFRDADTLGSLIDPRRAAEKTNPDGLQKTMWDVDFDEVAPLLEKAAAREGEDPATAVLGADAAGIARAATSLSRVFTLTATNPPYLVRSKQVDVLRDFVTQNHSAGQADLATAFVERCLSMLEPGGTTALLTPQNWLFLTTYTSLREALLVQYEWNVVARIGSGATATKSWDTLRTLFVASADRPRTDHSFVAVDATAAGDVERSDEVRDATLIRLEQIRQLDNPDSRIVFADLGDAPLLEQVAQSLQGISPADTARYRRHFWEVLASDPWVRWQRPSSTTVPYSGRDVVLRWDQSLFEAVERGDAFIRGQDAWGKRGVAVRQVGNLPATLYTGDRFDTSCAVIVPSDPGLVPALWVFVSSDEFLKMVRHLDRKLNVTNATLAKVPFDVERWRTAAAEEFPEGLPEPWSDDPTQWLFEGRPEVATEPLQVGVGRLVGYRWPEQPEADGLGDFVDRDGIVCLPAVGGELPAASRLTELLSVAFGDEWSPALVRRLLADAGSKKRSLDDWLRDDFFKHHCKVFSNRPFVWHVWDGRKDGFSALVNYHRLDRAGLEKLTYTYLGDWIERQRADAAEDVAGADVRLAAARELKEKLEAILAGEPPYDIYVRWKELHEQPIGWDPDLDDGVRLNIRPFVEAGVLRSKVNVHWKKDRGKNPDGSERHNDLHYTNDQKLQARQKAGGT